MCPTGIEMDNLRRGFRNRIGRGNTERDVLYGQLHLDAAKALTAHRETCAECGAKTREDKAAA